VRRGAHWGGAVPVQLQLRQNAENKPVQARRGLPPPLPCRSPPPHWLFVPTPRDLDTEEGGRGVAVVTGSPCASYIWPVVGGCAVATRNMAHAACRSNTQCTASKEQRTKDRTPIHPDCRLTSSLQPADREEGVGVCWCWLWCTSHVAPACMQRPGVTYNVQCGAWDCELQGSPWQLTSRCRAGNGI
jgi:hypothetical protein